MFTFPPITQEQKLNFLRTVCRHVANTLNRHDPDTLLAKLGARQGATFSTSPLTSFCLFEVKTRFGYSSIVIITILGMRRTSCWSWITSFVDPNTLNLDPDQDFGPIWIWIRSQGYAFNFERKNLK